ncbi:hypothetical protein CEUSTIGMA_g5377.t1 [Chlamydomonas eustigma]|uniref:DRBM domain-containing protein n=1 Tax=Chlamydomonas eustigma TaxID=1157962 RepID=A0A250X4E0_9CHLO|nr:hypothetical protein CEUSTIGMA_g5377.t1 [Chlamydomonas eustigma]|eukprot:GAX77935.1 hypothetical protein CEUSTIGMA_g5377.t1 [Chlamydomonas eustigma]
MKHRQLCTLYSSYLEALFLVRGNESDVWDFIDISHAKNVEESFNLVRDACDIQISNETYACTLEVPEASSELLVHISPELPATSVAYGVNSTQDKGWLSVDQIVQSCVQIPTLIRQAWADRSKSFQARVPDINSTGTAARAVTAEGSEPLVLKQTNSISWNLGVYSTQKSTHTATFASGTTTHDSAAQEEPKRLLSGRTHEVMPVKPDIDYAEPAVLSKAVGDNAVSQHERAEAKIALSGREKYEGEEGSSVWPASHSFHHHDNAFALIQPFMPHLLPLLLRELEAGYAPSVDHATASPALPTKDPQLSLPSPASADTSLPLEDLLVYCKDQWKGITPKQYLDEFCSSNQLAAPCYYPASHHMQSSTGALEGGPSLATCIISHLGVQVTPVVLLDSMEEAEQTAALSAILYLEGCVDMYSSHCRVVPVGYPPLLRPDQLRSWEEQLHQQAQWLARNKELMLQRLNQKRQELAREMAALERAEKAVQNGEEKLLSSCWDPSEAMLAMAIQGRAGSTTMAPESLPLGTGPGMDSASMEGEEDSSNGSLAAAAAAEDNDEVVEGVERLLLIAGSAGGSRALKRARVGGSSNTGWSSASAAAAGGKKKVNPAGAAAEGSVGSLPGRSVGAEGATTTEDGAVSSSGVHLKGRVQELKEVCERRRWSHPQYEYTRAEPESQATGAKFYCLLTLSTDFGYNDQFSSQELPSGYHGDVMPCPKSMTTFQSEVHSTKRACKEAAAAAALEFIRSCSGSRVHNNKASSTGK